MDASLKYPGPFRQLPSSALFEGALMWGITRGAAILALFAVYSPMLAYDFGHHGDYVTISSVRPAPIIFGNIWDFFFFYFESPMLLLIGRFLNAVLVSIQAHLMTSVEVLRPLRAFYLVVLCGGCLYLARVFVGHFRLSEIGACALSVLICVSPPMQQGLLILTFSAPLFVSLWAATASFVLYVRGMRRAGIMKLLLPVALFAVAMSCYPPGAMIFAALALLEIAVAVRVGGATGMTVWRFTVRVLAFLFLAIIIFFLLDRALFHLVFASRPAIASLQPPPFYTGTLFSDGVIESLLARFYNFLLCYQNAAGLWDVPTHSGTTAVVSGLIIISLLQRIARGVSAALLQSGTAWRVVWRRYLSDEVISLVCKMGLLVLTVFPFLIPGIAAGWFTGYRDAYRTLPAMEPAMLFLIFDLFWQLPLSVFSLQIQMNRTPSIKVASRAALVLRTALTLLVAVAVALSFRAANIGAIWANTQFLFYEDIYRHAEDHAVSTMFMPCMDDQFWRWYSPGLQGEYGYTSIGWEGYISRRLQGLDIPIDMEAVCDWKGGTQFGTGPYARIESRKIYVDYSRFVRDFSAATLLRAWQLPFVNRVSLPPNVFSLSPS